MATSLKLHDASSDGDLKQITTSEENYLAYRAGLNLAGGGKTQVGSLSDVNTPGAHSTVGTYTDTVYDQAIGTHGTTLTQTTTNTTVYQKDGVAGESGGNFRYPIKWDTSTNPDSIKEMTDAEVTTITDRLIGTIFANDYPGIYVLGTSAPSGDYDVHLSNIFTDTRKDGTSVNYNIYQRQSMTAPTAVRPVALKRSSGGSGTFQGLQEMSDTEIQYTFGQRARTRIMNGSNGIGTYLLLSATAGNPTANGYSGTWVAKGTATDTTNVTQETAYTRNRSSNYVGNYEQAFTRNFEGNYARTFVGNYARGFLGNYQRTFTGNYARTFEGNYIANFVGNYARTFQGNYSRAFTRTSILNRISTYTRDSIVNRNSTYTRNSTRTRVSSYTRNSTDVFSRNRISTYTRESTRSRISTYARISTRNRKSTYTRAVSYTHLTLPTTPYV